MTLHKFKIYNMAVLFHRQVLELSIPLYLRDQLLRASSSIVLNIAEGHGKSTLPDQRKFYSIALGSLRESLAALDIMNALSPEILDLSDQMGAILWTLSKVPR